MSPFEYLITLVSVLAGLALADLSTSLHRLLRARDRVRWDWAPLLADALLMGAFLWLAFTRRQAVHAVVMVLCFVVFMASWWGLRLEGGGRRPRSTTPPYGGEGLGCPPHSGRTARPPGSAPRGHPTRSSAGWKGIRIDVRDRVGLEWDEKVRPPYNRSHR